MAIKLARAFLRSEIKRAPGGHGAGCAEPGLAAGCCGAGAASQRAERRGRHGIRFAETPTEAAAAEVRVRADWKVAQICHGGETAPQRIRNSKVQTTFRRYA